jgi:hypothetical protein
VELGDEIIDKLLSEPTRLFEELTTFATAYIVASTYLAKHEELRQQPVFWRRLAAAAHAALATRILGPQDDPLFDWAMGLVGKTFYLSALNDAHIEPRWKPDWITPSFLAADIYGRLLQAVQRLGEAAPPSWCKKIEDAKDAVNKDVPPYAHAFPSLLQGRRVNLSEMPLPDTRMGETFVEFAAKPTVESVLIFFNLSTLLAFRPKRAKPSSRRSDPCVRR